ncbi:hypothetical protein ACT7DB_07740 [Bacillus cereus]
MEFQELSQTEECKDYAILQLSIWAIPSTKGYVEDGLDIEAKVIAYQI